MNHPAWKLVVTAPRTVELIAIDVPPLRPDQVRVEAHYLGISIGTELNTYRGGVNWHTGRDAGTRLFHGDSARGEWVYPADLGYALVGRISEVGSGARDRAVGQMVFGTAGHATQAVVAADRCWPVPQDADPRRYVFYQLVRTALNVTHHARLTFGDSVAVQGAGAVGLLTVQLLRRAGAGRIVVLDPLATRRETALRLGADAALDPATGDPALALREVLEGQGADVVIEASANEDALRQAPRLARVRGRVVLASMPSRPIAFHFGQEMHFNGIHLIGANVTAMPDGLGPGWDAARRDRFARELLGRLELLSLITQTYRFEDAPAAYRRLDEHPGDAVAAIIVCPAAGQS